MNVIRLNDAASIPVLGYGTWLLEGDECVRGVEEAVRVGYRHIDTADAYGNHLSVAKGIKNSGIPREELFITTKLRQSNGYAGAIVRPSVERFLQELDIPYIDLLLIHWPDRKTPFSETLKAMKELKNAGLVRALGVSNFTRHHLEDALAANIEISTNQVETHPTFNQKELRAFCASKGVVVTAYSPLGRTRDLELPLLQELANKYGVSSAQVALNWIVARGMVAIPKSAHPERIKDNFDSISWTMDEKDLTAIDALPQGERVVNPAFSDFDY